MLVVGVIPLVSAADYLPRVCTLVVVGSRIFRFIPSRFLRVRFYFTIFNIEKRGP